MKDGGGVLLDGVVHAVDFAGDAEVGRGLLMGGGVEDFVDVGSAAQAGDCGFGDVLRSRQHRVVLVEVRATLTSTLKYECSSIWNSNGSLPLFCTFSIVCRPSLDSVTEYTRANS